MLSEFGKILIFIVGAILFLLISLGIATLLRPKKPNPEKLSTYECGEAAIGSAWLNFPIRYYVVALIFLIFDVEIVFLFPWSVVFGKKEYFEATQGSWTWLALGEMFVFIIILALGLAYVWVKGYLDWEKPRPTQPQINNPLPDKIYEEFNEKQFAKK